MTSQKQRAALAILVIGLGLGSVPSARGQDGNGWLMNDLAAAQDKARRTGKPIFVTFRCER
jgi:hypothetical protein